MHVFGSVSFRSEQCSEWMRPYFDAKGRFHFHQFKTHLLEAIEEGTESVFGGAQFIKNAGYLTRITKNKSYSCWSLAGHKQDSCKTLNTGANKPTLFMQCMDCIVAISQTKMGACVQLQVLAHIQI